MVKPICVIYFPADYTFTDRSKRIDTLELMTELNGWETRNDNRCPVEGEKYGGYMYWCFIRDNITEPQFEVFHPKKFTKANYEELKKLVMQNLKANEQL